MDSPLQLGELWGPVEDVLPCKVISFFSLILTLYSLSCLAFDQVSFDEGALLAGLLPPKPTSGHEVEELEVPHDRSARIMEGKQLHTCIYLIFNILMMCSLLCNGEA